MKIIKRYLIGRTNLLLIRGNLFQDKTVQSYIVTTKLLRRYAKHFGLKCVEFNFPILTSRFFVFSKKDIYISRKRFFEWWFCGNNYTRSFFEPIWIDTSLVIPAGMPSDVLLNPSLVSFEKTSLIIVSQSDQGTGPRDAVEEVFSKVLNIASQSKISSLGSTVFGYSWTESGTINGIIDAIRSFNDEYPKEIRLFETNPDNEHYFADIIAELE